MAHFEFHDGWSFAREIVEDPDANTRFEIDFIKEIAVIDNDIPIEDGQPPNI